PPALVPVPATVAEAYEDDGVPLHSAMRKPLKKRSKAVSRVVVKPEYKEKANAKRARAKPRAKAAPATNGKPSRPAKIKSTRGGGPDRTRLQPKTRSDSKRAKTKPAIGRLHKAERRTASRKKQAVAKVSRGRPVKRAAAKK